MAGEPVLRAGDDGDWVRYLQQSLNHHYQQQVSAESGEFDAALDGAVRHFQAQQGIEPTGVVDALTWQALTGVVHQWPDEPVATAEVLAGEVVVRLALTLTGEAVGGDVLADLSVDLTTDPPTFTCTGATFLPGTATLTDSVTVEFTGSCALAGAQDTTGYALAVTIDPGDPVMSPADWLLGQTEPLTVPLPVVAGLGEVA